MKSMSKDEFREFLKTKIEESNYSLNQIALYSGVSAALISRTINGERWLSAKSLSKLAPYLKVDETELLFLAGFLKSSIHKANNYIDPDPDEQFFLRANKLSEKSKKKLWDYLELIELQEAAEYRKKKRNKDDS